jgi:DNA-binding PadR family transcriptional regulator
LLSLINEDRHGYAMVGDIEEMTGGQYHIPIATLYRTLDRLVLDGWIRELKYPLVREEDDTRRIYYRITDLGRAVCRAEMQRLAHLVNGPRGRRVLQL